MYDWESKFHNVLNEENQKTKELRAEIEILKIEEKKLDHLLQDKDEKYVEKEKYYWAEIL